MQSEVLTPPRHYAKAGTRGWRLPSVVSSPLPVKKPSPIGQLLKASQAQLDMKEAVIKLLQAHLRARDAAVWHFCGRGFAHTMTACMADTNAPLAERGQHPRQRREHREHERTQHH